MVLSHVKLGNDIGRNSLSVRVASEVCRESPVCQDVNSEIVFVTVATAKSLYDSLVKPPSHETCVAKVSRDEFFLSVDRTRQSCQDDEATLVGFKIHTVKS